MTAAFTCAYLKDRDPKWSICYDAGAIKAALETNSMGIDKIPTKSQMTVKLYKPGRGLHIIRGTGDEGRLTCRR
jgi:hypothetical protein